MPRIRSVHPGLFTDEEFVALSYAAQIFLVGLWTQADDKGVFEWKPITLRMRLRPNKDGPVDDLLEELCLHNQVRSFDIDGRQYGAVRNFRKYQRPKNPNSVYPITDELRIYVGLKEPSSEPSDVKDEPIPQKGEIPPQREDGGGRGRGRGSSVSKEETGTSALPDYEDEEETKTACYQLADKIGWRAAPTNLNSAGLSWPKVHAKLVEARTQADARQWLGGVLKMLKDKPPVRSGNFRGVDRPKRVVPHEVV